MFDINKPHKRRDGGVYEVVGYKDGYAFGFSEMNGKYVPTHWVTHNTEMFLQSPTLNGNYDIIQLPEEKEVVGYQRVFLDFIGDSYTNINDIKSDRILSKGIIKTTAKIIDGKLVSVKSEIVE